MIFARYSRTILALPVTLALNITPCLAQTASLELKTILGQVEQNHPKLRGAEAERRAAREKAVSKAGAFDPVVTLGADRMRYNSTTTPGKPLETATNEIGIEQPTRSGLKFFAGRRQNAGAVKSPLSRTGSEGEYIVGVKAPLLRGLSINDKVAAERQAQLGEPLAEQNRVLLRLNTLLGAAFTYWDWAAAGQKATVARNLLELARIRAEAVRTRAERGDIPRIDMAEADAEVQRRLGGLVKAEREVEKAALKLNTYLWDAEGNPSETIPAATLPQTLPVPLPLEPNQGETGRGEALRRRPELSSISLSRQILGVDRDLAQNDLQPNMDVNVTLGRDVGSLSIGNTVKAGVVFSVPLYRREATGRLNEANLKLQKLRQEEALLRQQIVTEVDDAISAMKAAYSRYQAAVGERDLARRLEQGERDRFALGDSTLFLVNQRERATAEAEVRLIEVVAEYHQASALYLAATGRLTGQE